MGREGVVLVPLFRHVSTSMPIVRPVVKLKPVVFFLHTLLAIRIVVAATLHA